MRIEKSQGDERINRSPAPTKRCSPRKRLFVVISEHSKIFSFGTPAPRPCRGELAPFARDKREREKKKHQSTGSPPPVSLRSLSQSATFSADRRSRLTSSRLLSCPPSAGFPGGNFSPAVERPRHGAAADSSYLDAAPAAFPQRAAHR